MDHVSRRDRVIVSLLCLTPLQRSRLDRLRDIGGPARCLEIALGENLSSIRRDLNMFRDADMIVRTGTQKTTRYCLWDDVVALMDAFPSIGRPRGSLDPWIGLAVLDAVRAIRAERRVPAVQEVADTVKVDRLYARKWMRRLRDVGMIDGLPTYSSPREWARRTAV